MAKNIDFMGATFPDVPSIRLPQHEGGLVSFTDVTDTTAVASDVANGKYFYTADGEKTVGTASGGITPSGTISITQNGQVDVTNYATADVNVSGGGASNFVHGEFHTLDTAGNQTIDIPYAGDGFPIMAYIVVKGGAYAKGTAWYSGIARYAIGVWNMSTANMSITPSYSTSKQAVVAVIYKSSTSSSTQFTGASSVIDVYQNAPSASGGNAFDCVKFAFNGKQMSVRTWGSTYGFMRDIDYEYFIVYSS